MVSRTQGQERLEFRDPSFKEVADYYACGVSWCTKGGFKDELGVWHPSGHHYKIDYWEVLNEPGDLMFTTGGCGSFGKASARGTSWSAPRPIHWIRSIPCVLRALLPEPAIARFC